MRSGGIETVANANENHRISKLAYDFEIPLKDLVQKLRGLAFWQCRSCWLVALGCPHSRPLRCDFEQPVIYIPSWRPLALGPFWFPRVMYLVYIAQGTTSATLVVHIHSPPPQQPAPYMIRHPPHTLTNTQPILDHHSTQSPTTTPPNPRPPLHPIPDHHSTQTPTTTPAHSMIIVSQVLSTCFGKYHP